MPTLFQLSKSRCLEQIQLQFSASEMVYSQILGQNSSDLELSWWNLKLIWRNLWLDYQVEQSQQKGAFQVHFDVFFMLQIYIKTFLFLGYVSHFFCDCYHCPETSMPLLLCSTKKSLSYIICSQLQWNQLILISKKKLSCQSTKHSQRKAFSALFLLVL